MTKHSIKWTDVMGNLHFIHNKGGDVRVVLFNGTPIHISTIDHQRAEEIRMALAACNSADEMVSVMRRFGQKNVEAVTPPPAAPSISDVDPVQVLWNNEGGSSIGGLIHTLAEGTPFGTDSDLSRLVDRARELYYPVEDWEVAAEQAGYERRGDGWTHRKFPGKQVYDSARECCEDNDIFPRYIDPVEYLVVSEWLARRLEEHGEKVETGFAELAVWAKTSEKPVLEHPALAAIAADYDPETKYDGVRAPGL